MFASSADGSDIFSRAIEGQATLLTRAAHDIAYNEVHDEFTIANPLAQAILTFRGGASGNEAPIRVIQGPLTQIVEPGHGVIVDPVHDELFVADGEYILVFPRTASGNVAPIRVLRGPKTRLSQAKGLAVDPINDLLVVTSEENRNIRLPSGQQRRGAWIMIFNRTAQGNTAPLRVIEGSKTLINRISNLRLTPKGWIVTHASGGLAVWNVHDQGDVPPRWILGGPKSQITGGGIIRIALNHKAKEVILTGGSGSLGGIRVYSFPEIF